MVKQIPSRMRRLLLFFCLSATVCGCSADSAKRITYETLQNVRQQQCQKEQAADCDKRQSYDDYQQQLKKSQENTSQ